MEDPSGAPLPAWRHRDARLPARLASDALLTPFDPIVWFRPRAERMFDFHYRIEIYTPKEQRRYGYYCLPLMVGGRLAGRIDLKADRAERVLLVQAAWREERAPHRTAGVAKDLLSRAAAWQGLDTVRTSGVGDLALPAAFDAA
ncbi:DNA glycosylase AlkZ-like family protein [Leucobacter soli]|uniref:DNA glycosylase AlkZ-like family protein n=1 Tax=Leucobacter soli TaxID=2812850 RepID=UPI003608E5C0